MRPRGELLLALMVLHTWWWATSVHVVEAGVTVPLNGLVLHYYKQNHTCTYAEEFIDYQVWKAWKDDHSIAPALLRLVYSDCFVTGCDASILLKGKGTEMTAPQNAGLRGFDLIDRVKRVLEARCPGVVSCADILHLAAKSAVALAGAPKYPVFTGRRDGTSSAAESVDLPPPSISWDQALSYFKSKGLDVLDLGLLLGAHTMGEAHCRYITDRLYNFNRTGRPDESMNRALLLQLRKQCPLQNKPGRPSDPTVFLNPTSGSNYSFTNSYYSRVLRSQGVLGVDQQLITSSDGLRIAEQFAASFEDFRRYFALSMSRMGSLGVLTGSQGEIRRNCSFTNAENPHF